MYLDYLPLIKCTIIAKIDFSFLTWYVDSLFKRGLNYYFSFLYEKVYFLFKDHTHDGRSQYIYMRSQKRKSCGSEMAQ